MAKEFAKPFYNSKTWKDIRKSYIAQRVALDGGMCERCHNSLGYILHHKKELTPLNITDPDVAMNSCNLEYVCKKCHDDIHYGEFHKDMLPDQRCFFDDDGNMVCNDRPPYCTKNGDN